MARQGRRITEAMITTAVLEMLEHNLVEGLTLAALTGAVSGLLGVPISVEYVRRSVRRNRHRISVEAGMIKLSLDWRNRR